MCGIYQFILNTKNVSGVIIYSVLVKKKKVSFKKKWKPVFSSEDKAAFLFNKHNKMVQTFLFPIKIFYRRILYLIYL